MRLLAIFLLSLPLFGAASQTIYEVDGVTQTNKPYKVAQWFAQGEIATCAQPLFGGVLIITTNWQCTVMNRWPDNSVRFAIVRFIGSLAANGSKVVTYQNAAFCNNTGGLTQAGMTGFTGFGAEIDIKPAGGTVQIANAITMLGQSDPVANAFGSCLNRLFETGPVATVVIVEDCTSNWTNDFGCHWDSPSGLMTLCTTGTGTDAVWHPWFVIEFYPTISAAKIDYAMESDKNTTLEDQLDDSIVLKAGSGLATVYSIGATGSGRKLTDFVMTNNGTGVTSATASFVSTDVGQTIDFAAGGNCSGDCHNIIKSVTNGTTIVLAHPYIGASGSGVTGYIGLHIGRTSLVKTFWSGTAPGTYRIDPNFPYLISAFAYPYYDLTVKTSPDKTAGSEILFNYAGWAATDRGDLGGINGEIQETSSNLEGKLVQREELELLYNANAANSFDGTNCGSASGLCAKAWQMLTGESGAIDTSPTNLTINNVSGGGGFWYERGNIPYHIREARSGGSFYCPGYASKDAVPSASCGTGVGNPIGKVLSKHAHPTSQNSAGLWEIAAIGSKIHLPNGWNQSGGDHWLDYSYTCYLLTGRYWCLTEMQQAAAWVSGDSNPGAGWGGQSNGFYAFNNPSGAIIRYTAWAVQTQARAALMSPDGTPESLYFTDRVNSNLEVFEGMANLSGTALTPASINTHCQGAYTNASANRWDWGHCGIASNCPNGSACATESVPPLHQITPGQASPSPGGHSGTVTSVSNANPAVFTVTINTGMAVPTSGATVIISGATALCAYLNGTYIGGANTIVGSTFQITGVSGVGCGGSLTGTVVYDTSNSTYVQQWQMSYFSVVLGELRENAAYWSQAAPLHNQLGLMLEEMVGDTAMNPYAIAANFFGIHQRKGAVDVTGAGLNTDPYINTYALLLTDYAPAYRVAVDFRTVNGENFACSNHGYSLDARAAGSQLKYFNINSVDTSCNGSIGACTAVNIWSWLNTNVPYFGNAPFVALAALGDSCFTGSDAQIPFALAQRPPTIATIGTPICAGPTLVH